MNRTDDLKVFISNRDSTCDECHEDLGRKAWIFLAGDRGALCLSCADLDHLAFLPSGDAALTRRAKKHSRLHAVVLKWSRTRKRYERQGLLVEEEALAQAEAECLADQEVRERQRERNALRRAELDEQYVARFAQRIREVFPGCPTGRRAPRLPICLSKYQRTDRPQHGGQRARRRRPSAWPSLPTCDTWKPIRHLAGVWRGTTTMPASAACPDRGNAGPIGNAGRDNVTFCDP